MEVKKTVTKKDLEITFFSGSGAGGQHRNKHQNCVRIRHPDSGVLVVSTEHKERRGNMKAALKRLSEHYRFLAWADGELRELEEGEKLRKDSEVWVEEQMNPKNIEEVKEVSNLYKKCKCKNPVGVTIWNCPICNAKD